MLQLVKKLFDGNEREVKKLEREVLKINDLEPAIKALSDEELRAKTRELAGLVKEEDSLDEILPEAFAVVREASIRTIGLRHFDVQMIGGMVLHQGRIAEMKTGEGKTLMATLPVYLNALLGKGVHIVTVNDYLAKRDCRWMGPVYYSLGLSVACIQHDSAFLYNPSYENEDESLQSLEPVPRRLAYMADITYGTNNEFGFDYLRDNMVLSIEDCVQRDLHYAIVDEVDSILIDEARTPLIISGRGTESTELYIKFARLVKRLTKQNDYTVDEKAHSVPLTEEGVAKVERELGITNLYDNEHMELAHHINQALRAEELYKKDVEYVAKDGEIVIVDEFTGRLMFGRRFSDGLHQAIEAKEGLKVRSEDQTLASITFQNYFRLYRKLAGMTGTAITEEKEFRDIYTLDVVVIPTHRPMVRADQPDLVYKTEKAKFEAAVEEITRLHEKGQPVLVGTRSIEKSEVLGLMLKRKGIPHQILNAKYHEKEAMIIAQAGRRGAVTIATNMAGRGVDILLGGNPPDAAMAQEIIGLGGLFILGTERHESRRIDNQLRGRSGRQGDPGASRFYVALEDELMRLFGSERISGLMDRLGIEEDVPIEHKWISKAIENAQQKVEMHHFDIRKHVLEYDDVMNKQRETIYNERRRILTGEDLGPTIIGMREGTIDAMVELYAPAHVHPDQWDREALLKSFKDAFPLPFPVKLTDLATSKVEELRELLLKWACDAYEYKEKTLTSDVMRQLERFALLRILDEKWIDHLYSMDILREGIGLRAYGQKDPRIEYINEAFDAFEALKERIQEETIKFLYRVQVQVGPLKETRKARETRINRGEDGGVPVMARRGQKVGRNELCPCGSGKKYKKCCGR
ncbi:MAG: preprotein translocase subunit SecA [Candidatus Eremiobacteraeota bacterium]|nr:preprotein translocase subunit SecA [Candidatus Eremiobacteraeota bacterium]